MENVLKLTQAKTKPPRRAKSHPTSEKHVSPRTASRLRLQRVSALVLGAVATGMTAVSVTHIASGTEYLTHVAHWQAWSLAAGIDVNYVGMEFAGLVAALQATRDKLHRFTKWGIPSIMVLSQAMNVLEFTRDADTAFAVAAGAAMGIVLPGLVWLGFRIAAILADV